MRFKLLVYSTILIFTHSLLAQNTLQSFGRSRLQNKVLDWKMLTSANSEVFYYQDGAELGNMAARFIEADFEKITELLGYTPYSKIKIFIYNSVQDLQQSNLGINQYELLGGGKTRFVKSRTEVAFTGSQVEFQKELRYAIAQVIITEMMFGGSLKDMLQSAYLLTLPDWFISGAAAYVADGWSEEMDDYTRDLIFNKHLRRPAALSDEEARKTGHAIWNYIGEKYGKSNISNILNLTRIIRNEETSIASTLGLSSYNQFLRDCRNYYGVMADQLKAGYKFSDADFRLRNFKRNKFEYNQIKISPDGKLLTYSENHNGRYRVYVMNTANRHKKVIFKGGQHVVEQRIDYSLPLLAWKSNISLGIIYPRHGKNYFRMIDTQRKGLSVKFNIFGKNPNRKELPFYQIADFSVSGDGSTLALSANRKGQTDIFTYKISSGAVKQITNDFYDDITPVFLKNSNENIVFSSNRLSDTLNTPDKGNYKNLGNRFDLFIFRNTKPVLERIANAQGNQTHPTVAGNSIFYLSDETGIKQLYKLENNTTTQVSGFLQSIQTYSLFKGDTTQTLAYRMIDNRHNFLGYHKKFDFNNSFKPLNTGREEILEEKGIIQRPVQVIGNNNQPITKDSVATNIITPSFTLAAGEVDTENYQFDSDSRKAKTEKEPSKKQIDLADSKLIRNEKTDEISIKGPYAYQNRFSIDNTLTGLEIDPIRGLGITGRISINDMLEDHRFNAGGTVFLTSTRSTNLFMEYEYLKRKVDLGARFERKTYFYNLSEVIQKYTLNRVQVSAAYPLNNSSRFVVTPFLTTTRYTDLSWDNKSGFYLPDVFKQYVGVKAEYIFDNTTFNGLNMIQGTRARIKFEAYEGISQGNTSFNNILADIRHYQPLHRDIIFATRIAFGRFFGKAAKSYVLGGMDNWAFNAKEERANGTFNPIAPPNDSPQDRSDILFAEFATPLRGFRYNKLFGENFVLANAEIRFPVIRYFYRSPITSNFFRNLQLVGFTDIGAAWTGKGPLSQESELNTLLPVRLNDAFYGTTVTFYRNPFLIGYGAGLRTMIFNFYTKLDVAWGVEDFQATQNKVYLTIGYDF
jgi:hypothetical protein